MNAAESPDPLPLAAVLARWDALVVRWDLAPEERSTLLGCFGGGPVDAVSTYQVEVAIERMRLLITLEPALAHLHGSETRVRGWLRRPNVNLAGRTPLEVMGRSPAWTGWLIGNLGGAS